MDILGLIDIPVWALILLTTCFLFYYYTSINYGVFVRMGIKGPRPLPVLGNLLDYMRKGFVEAEMEWLKKYGRIFGIHEGHFPTLIIVDLDMLKDITVKEFSSFTNRRTFGLERYVSPPHSHFLNLQVDDEWRHNRNTQTPTFSGGKLKRMMPLINKACESMVKTMKEKADTHEPIEAKRYTGAYTMEVIASTAFGMDLDVQNNPDDPFVKYARKFFEFSLFDPLFLSVLIIPFSLAIIGALKLPTLPPDSQKFFTEIVKRALNERRNNPGKFNDFLELLLKAEREAHEAGHNSDVSTNHEDSAKNEGVHWVDKRKGKGLSDDEILAACVLFFSAGYDTTATTLSYAIFHLANYPDCQDKLIAEIDEHFPDGETPTYESLGDLPYLEMVVMETLRISPPVARVERDCSRDVTIRGLHIPAGTAVAIPIYLIHHDPGYWPEPEVFNPDRFTPENRAKHHPLQWVPFGYGPRNCIGMRLAYIEMKLALIHLLRAFRFSTNSKTKPLKFGTIFLLTSSRDGTWVSVENRQ